MIDIIDFKLENQTLFKTLNYEWLSKYFKVEPIDELLLSNPKEEIIDKGGHIIFAKIENTIVGTVALINRGTHFELSKMAVNHQYQNRGIGTKLMESALDWSAKHDVKYLLLYSHSKLKSALKIYENFGFKYVTLDNNLYSRADIVMEINL